MIEPESAARALSAEAHALHRAVFGGSPPDSLVDAYVAAHRALWPAAHADADASSHRPEASLRPGEESVRRAIERGLDLEALELYCRLRRPKHTLVKKAQILVYLAEGLPQYQAQLVGETHRTRGALWKLGGHGVRSIWKLVKGAYLIRRHRIE